MDGTMEMKMREWVHPYCLSRIGMIVFYLMLLLPYGGICQVMNDEQLSSQLAKIRSRSFEKESDYTLAETDALKLLDAFPTSFATGKVCLAIEKIWAKNIGARPEKVAEYCEKSLRSPQDADEACKLYVDWGSALKRQRQDTEGMTDSVKARREIVKPYLRAWSIVFRNDIPDKLQDIPDVGVGKFDYGGSETDQVYLAMVKQHDAEWKASERARIKRELVLCRATIVADCIAQLYGGQNGISDLRADAKAELHDPAAVEDLVQRVQNFNNAVAH